MATLGPGNVVPDHKKCISFSEFESDILRSLQFAKNTSPLSLTRFDENIMFVDGILTETECTQLIASIDASPQLSFWSNKGREHEETRRYRNVDTVEVEYQRLTDALTVRLRSVLSLANDTVAEDDSRELAGEWEYSGLNHDCLFSRYPSGGSFAPHTDGSAIHTFDRRSFYSVIIYLNTLTEGCGGGTRFYSGVEALQRLQPRMYSEQQSWTSDPALVLTEVPPVAGRMLIFKQHLVHEGIPPIEGNRKYIIRSDLMYDRSPPVLSSPDDVRAYELYQEAEYLSETGKVDESIVLFRKALKMSFRLAEALGQ